VFPSANSLPSTASATGCPVLFCGFIGTTELSDFPGPFIVGYRPWASRRGPWCLSPRADLGPPGSHTRCVRACPGS